MQLGELTQAHPLALQALCLSSLLWLLCLLWLRRRPARGLPSALRPAAVARRETAMLNLSLGIMHPSPVRVKGPVTAKFNIGFHGQPACFFTVLCNANCNRFALIFVLKLTLDDESNCSVSSRMTKSSKLSLWAAKITSDFTISKLAPKPSVLERVS